LRILVYVEGPSDCTALRTIFKDLIRQAGESRVGLSFISLSNKAQLIRKVGGRAASHLKANPDDWVFAMPDLYPLDLSNGPGKHKTKEELRAFLQRDFDNEASKVGMSTAKRAHYRPHCFKYDLEALLLADPSALRGRLETSDKLESQWRQPVEDQNDSMPPKVIVDRLFKKYKSRRYNPVVDASAILARASMDTIRKACGQCFGPLVDELSVLAAGRSLS